MGQRQVENVSPESRLLTGIKRGTKQLTVYHPSSISDEVINQQMAAIAASQGKAEYWKLSAACCALPVALTVDTLVLIGLPPMLTGYTGTTCHSVPPQFVTFTAAYALIRTFQLD